MQELIGKKLGQYQIKAKIGEGGMATVFRAYQPSLERYVALKVLLPALAGHDPKFIKRFQREAKSIAQLKHPHILPVYDFGVDQGYSYIAMQYVESGQTLSRLMHRPLGEAQAIELIGQIGQALAYAHKKGIVHRDLKPSNVLIAEGWTLLSDFGLAKTNEASLRLTDTGMSLGTPAYMSPEQGQGGTIDHRTDIYALGVILYEMLTETIPHQADTPLTMLYKRIHEPPRPPREIKPDISESIEQVILQALATQPEDRFNSVTDFVTALQKAATSEAEDETTVFSMRAQSSRPGSSSKKNAVLIWAGVGVVIAGVGGMWGWNMLNSSSSASTPTPATAMIAAVLDPTATPIPLPTQTPQPTQPPSTDTPTPTSPPSPTVTSTFTPVVVPPTSTTIPTTTSTPTPDPPTLTPTPTIFTGSFKLLTPLVCDEPSYGLTEFEWEWPGDLPPEVGFEVRIWHKEGLYWAGVHNAVQDNQVGRVEKVDQNRYRLLVDVSGAQGIRGSGQYRWTVALVRISPNYADLGQQAEPANFCFNAGGAEGGGGGGNGNETGGSSGTIY